MEIPGVRPARIRLLDRFELTLGEVSITMPLGARRLLCYLALANGGTLRSTASETLWPHGRGERGSANLRSALWHCRSIGQTTLVECGAGRIRLAAGVEVDLRQASQWGHETMATPRAADHSTTPRDDAALLGRALLPDWPDDWLAFDRERWDQVRLHTLEVLARRLLAAGQYLAALEAAMTAVAIEPVRESANRTVMEVYIAEGNPACAIKHYQRFRGLLQRELGVAPTAAMDRLLRPLVAP